MDDADDVIAQFLEDLCWEADGEDPLRHAQPRLHWPGTAGRVPFRADPLRRAPGVAPRRRMHPGGRPASWRELMWRQQDHHRGWSPPESPWPEAAGVGAWD